jgi:hypothetical protein
VGLPAGLALLLQQRLVTIPVWRQHKQQEHTAQGSCVSMIQYLLQWH